MLPAIAGIGMFMNAMEQQKAQAEARRQAQAQILQQSAANLGAPTYNVQGAQQQMRFRQDEREKRNALLRSLMSSYGKGGGGQAVPSGDPFGGAFGGY